MIGPREENAPGEGSFISVVGNQSYFTALTPPLIKNLRNPEVILSSSNQAMDSKDYFSRGSAMCFVETSKLVVVQENLRFWQTRKIKRC